MWQTELAMAIDAGTTLAVDGIELLIGTPVRCSAKCLTIATRPVPGASDSSRRSRPAIRAHASHAA